MERITASLIGMEVTVIMRTDRNLAWQLIPLMGVYGESDLSAMDTPENIRILSREPTGRTPMVCTCARSFHTSAATARKSA